MLDVIIGIIMVVIMIIITIMIIHVIMMTARNVIDLNCRHVNKVVSLNTATDISFRNFHAVVVRFPQFLRVRLNVIIPYPLVLYVDVWR